MRWHEVQSQVYRHLAQHGCQYEISRRSEPLEMPFTPYSGPTWALGHGLEAASITKCSYKKLGICRESSLTVNSNLFRTWRLTWDGWLLYKEKWRVSLFSKPSISMLSKNNQYQASHSVSVNMSATAIKWNCIGNKEDRTQGFLFGSGCAGLVFAGALGAGEPAATKK